MGTTLKYTNGEMEFAVSINTYPDFLDLVEMTNSEDILINGNEARVAKYSLHMRVGETLFMIGGWFDGEVDEFIKIAESIR